uniref:Uncharacterized protein n=1 Tax=Knipowitschia caucasica TaxID=637954 RepID=A0AAV2KKG3_KNICA
MMCSSLMQLWPYPNRAMVVTTPEAMVLPGPEEPRLVRVIDYDYISTYGYEDFVREFNKLLEEEYQPGAMPEPEACHENEAAPQGFWVMDIT